MLSSVLDVHPNRRLTAAQLRSLLREKFPSPHGSDEELVAAFLKEAGGFREPPRNPPVAVSAAPEPEDEHSLKGAVQSLAVQIHEVQAAVADMTAVFRRSELVAATAPGNTQALAQQDGIDAAFMTVRRRLEWSWRLSLIMTFVLFSLFVAMLVLAIIVGVIYQKSYLGIIFGGASGLSLFTVVVWKPMDKMLFSTIATQQLELIQINYQRAMSGSPEERREAFRDVSTQINSLLIKVSAKSR